MQNSLAAIVAGDDEVEIAVVVVVAPDQIAALNTGKGTVSEHDEVAVAIIDPQISAQTVVGNAGSGEVGIAVAIVVAPSEVG